MQRSNHCHFHCARGFATPVLAHMLDSLVRVSRRGKENHFVLLSHRPMLATEVNSFRALPRPVTKHNSSRTQRPSRKRPGKYDQANTGFLRFPFSNFRYSLTLFSKFFASFPHGTCRDKKCRKTKRGKTIGGVRVMHGQGW